jgi:hypothetical protein
MPRNSQQSSQQQPSEKTEEHKQENIEFRVDSDLAQKAREKAASRGWTLSSVLRALVGLWVEEDVIHAEDVAKANKRAPRTGKKKKQGKQPDK